MTAREYLRAKWPASAKRWAAIAAVGAPALAFVKGQQFGFGLQFFGLILAAFAIFTVFAWAMSAVTLYVAGAYQESGRQLPDWASKDAYGDD